MPGLSRNGAAETVERGDTSQPAVATAIIEIERVAPPMRRGTRPRGTTAPVVQAKPLRNHNLLGIAAVTTSNHETHTITTGVSSQAVEGTRSLRVMR
jgi:7-cyano-7-deazaguanine synthase in queuosine biosynthesis